MEKKINIAMQYKIQLMQHSLLNWRVLAFYLLVMIVSPNNLSAQFININIDIPAKSGVSDLESSDMDWKSVVNSNRRELESTFTLTISSAENVQVMAILKHSDYLISPSGSAIKLNAALAYRNDGQDKPKKVISSDVVVFPMSDSGLLIDYMKDSPQLLQAYLMVFTTLERPVSNNEIYTGDIVLTIEYN